MCIVQTCSDVLGTNAEDSKHFHVSLHCVAITVLLKTKTDMNFRFAGIKGGIDTINVLGQLNNIFLDIRDLFIAVMATFCRSDTHLVFSLIDDTGFCTVPSVAHGTCTSHV